MGEDVRVSLHMPSTKPHVVSDTMTAFRAASTNSPKNDAAAAADAAEYAPGEYQHTALFPRAFPRCKGSFVVWL